MSAGGSPPRSRDYWFSAKRSGLGWGLPLRWQGWVVLGVHAWWTVGLVAVLVLADDATSKRLAVAGLLVGAVTLVAVCWRTGEPMPRDGYGWPRDRTPTG